MGELVVGRGSTRRRRLVAAGALTAALTGMLVVQAAPAHATSVNNEAGFRAAWSNPAETQIDLAADITLTDCVLGSPFHSGAAITLIGHGHTLRQTCTGQSVVSADGFLAVTVEEVTITGGASSKFGGGIDDGGVGPLTVSGSTITANSAAVDGGGIEASGPLTVNNSMITQNAAVSGGGIDDVGGSVTVMNSAIADNSTSNLGAGIATSVGTALVVDSTISGNTAGFSGGGINASTSATVTNSTINGNTAGDDGSGIVALDGPLAITNSTVVGNAAGPGGLSAGGGLFSLGPIALVYATITQNSASNGANISGMSPLLGSGGSLGSFGSVVALESSTGENCADLSAMTTHGFNFSDEDTSCGFAASTDHQNGGNPELGALADNGGPTQTRLPEFGSPLVDAIPISSCQADGAAGIGTDHGE